MFVRLFMLFRHNNVRLFMSLQHINLTMKLYFLLSKLLLCQIYYNAHIFLKVGTIFYKSRKTLKNSNVLMFPICFGDIKYLVVFIIIICYYRDKLLMTFTSAPVPIISIIIISVIIHDQNQYIQTMALFYH